MAIKETKKHPLIIISQNDKEIIRRMKKIGVWSKMKELSKSSQTIAVLFSDELFIHHGIKGDSGFNYFKGEPGMLLFIAGLATNAKQAGPF